MINSDLNRILEQADIHDTSIDDLVLQDIDIYADPSDDPEEELAFCHPEDWTLDATDTTLPHSLYAEERAILRLLEETGERTRVRGDRHPLAEALLECAEDGYE